MNHDPIVLAIGLVLLGWAFNGAVFWTFNIERNFRRSDLEHWFEVLVRIGLAIPWGLIIGGVLGFALAIVALALYGISFGLWRFVRFIALGSQQPRGDDSSEERRVF